MSPLLAPSLDIQQDWWTKKTGLGIEFRAIAIVDVKRHLYLFPKTFSTVLTHKLTQSDTAATPRLTPNALAATRSVQILLFTQKVFHTAAWCQQLADFKVQLCYNVVEHYFFITNCATRINSRY